MAENKERTFIMVKPDGVQRGLVGKIIQRFEEKGFKLVAMRMVWVSRQSLLRRPRTYDITKIDSSFMNAPRGSSRLNSSLH